MSIRFKKVIAFISACAMVGTTIPAGFVFAADTLLGPDSATIAQATPTYTSSTIDASGHENLNLSFNYNAEGFDAGDSFTYGWRASGGSDNDLGTINGVTESGTTTASDEIGSVSTPLPLGAQIANLEIYVKSTTNSGSDSATLSNITLQGDLIPPPPAPTPSTVVVTPSNMQGWTITTAASGTVGFLATSSPLGTGPLKLTTNADANSRGKITHTINSVPLSSVVSLSYKTNQVSAADVVNGNATLRVGLDLDGNGTLDDELMYEPYYNGFNGTSMPGWQEWDISSTTGKFWSNYTQTYNGLGGVSAGSYASNFTLGDVLHDYATAKIVSLTISMGTYNFSQVVLADELHFLTSSEDTTYDFNPDPIAPVAPSTRPALSGDAIYDAIPAVLPSNSVSLGYQAQQTSEFGDKIIFATSTGRALKEGAVMLSSWACESGAWELGTCTTTPGATFTHPITLNLYNVAGDGSVGTLIASRTQTFEIPYRPSANPECSDPKQWKDTNGDCFNGYNYVVVFDLTGITVPDSVIYGIAYNTQTYGASPIGSAGPYNSLNVSLNTDSAAPYIGTDVDTDQVFWDTQSNSAVGFASDNGWSPYKIAATFTAVPVPEVPTGLRYDNPAKACGDFTNVNYTQPKWDAVSGAVSYDYQALFNHGVVFSANYATNQHPGGTFGGGTNGVWGFQVRSVDAYGQKSDWSPECSITLDTVAPAMPVHLSPADNSTQNVNDFYFDWTDVPGVTEYEFQSSQNPAVDGTGALTTGVWNNKANGAPDRDFLASSTIHSYGANGTWYWQVRAIDAAGNKSPWTTPWKMTISLTPDAPILTGFTQNGATLSCGSVTDTNGTSPLTTHMQWTEASGNIAQYAIVPTYPDGTGQYTYYPSGSALDAWIGDNFGHHGDGTYSYTIKAQGTNGLWSSNSATCTLVYDTAPPEPPDTTPPSVPTGLAWTGSDSVPVPDTGTTNLYAGTASWNANGESDFDHYVYVYWNDIASSSYNSEGAAWTTTTPSPSLSGVFNQGEGTHHFCVKAVDTSGNTSACSAPFTITYALPHEEEPELTPITLCKYVGETRQSGWGMTLTGGHGEVPYVISTTTDETGCVTVSVDLADGPWTATEEMREGYVQDSVDAVQGDQIFLDEDQTEAACEFYDGYEDEPESFSQSGPTCTFFNSEVPSGGGGESGTSTESFTSGGSSSSGTRVGNRTILPQGEVLGASTTAEEDESFCVEPYITDTLGYGRTNNPEQVTRLQTFLNDHDNAELAVTGVFETTTRDAVMDFQLRYADEILTPWGITNPTGLVYYTTRKKINEIMCGHAYPLTQAQLDEIARIRDDIAHGGTGTSTPEGTVAGTSTTESEMGSPDSSSTEQVEGDGGGNTGGGAEPGFFQRLWNAIFG